MASIIDRIRRAITGGGRTTAGDKLRPKDYLPNIIGQRLPNPPPTFQSLTAFVSYLQRVQQELNRRNSSSIRLPSRFWTRRDLDDITSDVEARLFDFGLNSDDQPMRARRSRLPPGSRGRSNYRDETGSLRRSIEVTTNRRNGIVLEFRNQPKGKIEGLNQMYGSSAKGLFSFSPTTIQRISFRALQKLGLIDRRLRPGSEFPYRRQGPPVYNPPRRSRRRSRSRATRRSRR